MSPRPGPAFEFVDVQISFGGNTVLEGVNLAASPGVTGLIGPNGAGKTTLFNVATGYVKPSQGLVRLEGAPLRFGKPARVARRGVRRTFQTPRLVGELSVLDNVVVGAEGTLGPAQLVASCLSLDRRALRHRQEAAGELLNHFGISHLLSERAERLSLGSQKIVEVARALIASPKVLLLDEPAAGLSGLDVDRLVDPLLALADSGELTIIIIEHDMELVSRLCRDVAALHFGRIIAQGSPAEVLAHDDVVAAYLGASLASDV
jgi:branched-chain amino acid transport system ATP-binding protein